MKIVRRQKCVQKCGPPRTSVPTMLNQFRARTGLCRTREFVSLPLTGEVARNVTEGAVYLPQRGKVARSARRMRC